jgi:hypothetical protein
VRFVVDEEATKQSLLGISSIFPANHYITTLSSSLRPLKRVIALTRQHIITSFALVEGFISDSALGWQGSMILCVCVD